MMACRYCGVRLMRFTRPFSRPPTARRKITWAMSGRASCTRFRGCARAPAESVPEADGSSLAITAATARSVMGGIIQAGPDRRLLRVDEVGQLRLGLLILHTKRQHKKEHRSIAGLAHHLGLCIPQLR